MTKAKWLEKHVPGFVWKAGRPLWRQRSGICNSGKKRGADPSYRAVAHVLPSAKKRYGKGNAGRAGNPIKENGDFGDKRVLYSNGKKPDGERFLWNHGISPDRRERRQKYSLGVGDRDIQTLLFRY